MAFTIENEDGTILLLPKTTPELVDPDKARAAIDRDRNIRRSHLYPLIDATARFACSLLIAAQGCEAFDLPRSPWILIVGDDLNFAWGPSAFDRQSLDAAIGAADHCVLVTCGPDPWPYRVAATVAVRDRKNALLIESLPHQQEAWRNRVEGIRGDKFPITFCMPLPKDAA